MDEHRRTSEATAADLAVHLLVKHAVKKIVKVLSTSGNVEIQRGKAGLIARELLPRNFGFVNCCHTSTVSYRNIKHAVVTASQRQRSTT